MTTDAASIIELLHEVKDPEIPVVSVVELGIVRGVLIDEPTGEVTVQITPTYSGCPAMRVIEDEIREALQRHGFAKSRVVTVFNPPWTTDWITDAGRRKMKEYGIAPPGAAPKLVQLRQQRLEVACPFCDSPRTRLTSQFSGTSCKALYFCDGCQQPFEHFKAY